jgi:hypothetical protein
MKGKKINAKERIENLRINKDARKAVFKELITHVKSGLSMDCFGPLSENTISLFLKDFKEEFIQEDLDDAIRHAKGYWEGLGRAQANGTCMGNSRSWYYNMAQRYGWRDKIDIQAEHKGSVEVSIVNYAGATKLTDIPKQ